MGSWADTAGTREPEFGIGDVADTDPEPPGAAAAFQAPVPGPRSRQVEVVAGVIRDARGRVLLTRRTEGRDLAGLWEFPGGKLEVGETVQACIVRELAEELGVVCEAGEVLATNLHTYPGVAIELVAVRVHMAGDAMHLSVHDEARWVGAKELLSLDLAPADIPIPLSKRSN